MGLLTMEEIMKMRGRASVQIIPVIFMLQDGQAAPIFRQRH